MHLKKFRLSLFLSNFYFYINCAVGYCPHRFFVVKYFNKYKLYRANLLYLSVMKGFIMKYCKKCRRINNDSEQKCTVCGKELAKINDDNTPVYLLSASGFELQRIKTALEDSGIPCDNISQKHNFSAEAVTGYDSAEYDVLVPYSAYEQSYDCCVGIGAIKEDGEEIIDDDTPVENKNGNLDEQFEKMSGAKRTTVRVVSALLFLILVAFAVFGTDFIMGVIKNLFS